MFSCQSEYGSELLLGCGSRIDKDLSIDGGHLTLLLSFFEFFILFATGPNLIDLINAAIAEFIITSIEDFFFQVLFI